MDIWKNISSEIVYYDDILVKRAEDFSTAGLSKKDALHISSAVSAGAVFFITVDKGIIKKRKLIREIKIVNPIEFINFMEERDEK